jgi:hypothetical protein
MKNKSTAQKLLTFVTVATSIYSLSLAISQSVQASSPQMLKRIGSNFCLNAHNPRNESTVNLWGCDSNDPDQKWEKIPITTGTTTQWMIKRVGSNFCLNAHNPRNESTVNLWRCDSNDPDQKWEEINNQMLRRAGSSFCLNAHNPGSESKVNLWQCDSNDPDQQWEKIALSGNPAPVDFTLPVYRTQNPFWNAGYAPISTNPPNPKLGNAKGNCTWYANGRTKQLGRNPARVDRMLGNAYQWDDQARAAGISLSRTPEVGAIAQWESNHVAVVERVNADGTILISESSYSATSGSSWDFLYRTRTIRASEPSTFILP